MDSKYYSKKLIQNTFTISIAAVFDVLSIRASKISDYSNEVLFFLGKAERNLWLLGLLFESFFTVYFDFCFSKARLI